MLKVGRHRRQQIWLVKIELLAQFQPQRTRAASDAGKSKLENGSRLAVEVGTLRGGYEHKAGLGGGGFN
jgi:hypothetical protein